MLDEMKSMKMKSIETFCIIIVDQNLAVQYIF